MRKRNWLWALALIWFGWGIGSIGQVEAAQTAVSSPVRITEVYYHTDGDDATDEWIEIANLGEVTVELGNYKLGDEETAAGDEGMMRFPADAVITPGQVIIVAQTAVGFTDRYGFAPDFEMQDTSPDVPDMRRFPLWATGNVALGNDGDEVILMDEQNHVVDVVSYGNSTALMFPAVAAVEAGWSLERVPAVCDTDSLADWQAQAMPTPGEVTLEGECAEPVNPAELESLPPIGTIQGNGRTTPRIGERVTFRGVVTGIYIDRNSRGDVFYTFFVQDLPGMEDGDPSTSDGLAVFHGREAPPVKIGDQVRVTGRATEYYEFTELDDDNLEIIVEAENVPLPEPIVIDPPADEAALFDYFERYEGMLVKIDGTANVIGPTYSGCGFAVTTPSSGLSRVFRRQSDDPAGQAMTVLHYTDVSCAGFPNVKTGDQVSGIVGPLIYNFEQYKIVQQSPELLAVTAVPYPEIPPLPTLQPDQISIATFNFENHFDAIDDTGDDAEPKPAPEEIAIKQTKLAYAISHTLECPTLIGVQEVEKESLLLDLAAAVAESCGFTYEVTHRESADGRGIDVALLSDPRRVTVLHAELKQTCTRLLTDIEDPNVDCPMGDDPLFSRPPLQVTLEIDGQPLTIIVNHFKSKRGGETATAPRRLAQAEHINTLVDELLAQNEAARVVVVGDLNDYELSPPLQALTSGNGRLTNVLLQIPDEERYSFIFSGVSQLIDAILVSPSLVDRVSFVTIRHVNADYPDAFGQDVSPEGLPYRATDHDLPLVILSLGGEETAVSATATSPAATDQPPTASTNSLGPVWGWLIGILVAGTAVVAFILWRKR
ncbi:MAG: hypothetical protein D6706_05755 [Chloroflexi bacterium]|nr:MAG: hypothetical protein D6706_05755 [Chloroflexota bacterium]